MFLQIVIGSSLTLATILTAALSWWALEAALAKLHPWSQRPPHGPKLMVVLVMALICTLLMMTLSVWIWAAALYYIGIFATFEGSVYFALVAFTTLGFGDVLLPAEWRLLSGMSAANGLLMFGFLTAMLVETLRETRQSQRRK